MALSTRDRIRAETRRLYQELQVQKEAASGALSKLSEAVIETQRNRIEELELEVESLLTELDMTRDYTKACASLVEVLLMRLREFNERRG